MTNPLVTEYRLAGPNGNGRHPYLNGDGAFLGEGTPLLEKDQSGRWRPRPQSVLEKLLTTGYGIPVNLDWRMHKLACVAHALNRGDRSLAAITLVHTELPVLPEGSPRRMAKADGLLKSYDPAEPRVPAGSPGGGRWTSGDLPDSIALRPAPESARVQSAWGSPVGTPECEEEWAAAAIRCAEIMSTGRLNGLPFSGAGSTWDQCLKGQVSAICGGNGLYH